MSLVSKIQSCLKTYPVIKGMISYGVIWPCGSLIQQTISGKRLDTYDWNKCLKFSLYGGLFVAPTLYCWIRLSSSMWPASNLITGIKKVIINKLIN